MCDKPRADEPAERKKMEKLYIGIDQDKLSPLGGMNTDELSINEVRVKEAV